MATTLPSDVDLRGRVWRVPPAKGGDAIPLYLNDDTLFACRVFIAEKAWGRFDTSDLADIQAWMGYRRIRTTRSFCVAALLSRLKAMSERADKRLGLTVRGHDLRARLGSNIAD